MRIILLHLRDEEGEDVEIIEEFSGGWKSKTGMGSKSDLCQPKKKIVYFSIWALSRLGEKLKTPADLRTLVMFWQ